MPAPGARGAQLERSLPHMAPKAESRSECCRLASPAVPLSFTAAHAFQRTRPQGPHSSPTAGEQGLGHSLSWKSESPSPGSLASSLSST